ncbi:MAG: glycine/sarcosine/betaine reductase component B subunit, partial [Dehalococcoidia bacterium]|nr:glycine/sarcosine/betaine reductase component B subunit [Dehalococcoidia bacterium]
MRLELAVFPVTDVQFGERLELEGSRLFIDLTELQDVLSVDSRIRGVDVDIARPGESSMAGFIFDIIEPRARVEGASNFPGILGPYAPTGDGTTNVLRGTAVTTLDEESMAGGKVLVMTGDATDASPYATLNHLVITPHVDTNESRASTMNALKTAGLRAATYLAETATKGKVASTVESFDLENGASRLSESGDRLRVAFIGQVHGHQHMIERGDHIVYGSDLVGAMPIMLHPNEWLDGAVALSYWNNHPEETYFHQNHPMILELYGRHQAGEITFAGTMAVVAASDEDDRERNCMMAANLAKWTLKADAVVLTKYGGGAPHADMGQTARLCENLGMRTAV